MKYLILLIILISSCNTFGQENEAVYLNLTDIENWEITENNYKDNQHVILLANNKTSEHLSLISYLKMKNSDLVKAMNNFYNIEKGKSKDVKLSLIEEDQQVNFLLQKMMTIIKKDGYQFCPLKG